MTLVYALQQQAGSLQTQLISLQALVQRIANLPGKRQRLNTPPKPMEP